MSLVATGDTQKRQQSFSGDESQQGVKPDIAAEQKAYDTYLACHNEKDNYKKIELAKTALEQYPNSQYAPSFKQEIWAARDSILTQALTSNNLAAAFPMADEILKDNPENLGILLTLAEAGAKAAKNKGDYAFADKSIEYSKNAIALLNSGVMHSSPGPDWQKRKPLVLSSLHQTIGLFLLHAKKNDEAMAELMAAAQFDCSDPETYYLMSKIHYAKYESLGYEYIALSDEKKEGDEGKAQLDKIYSAIDLILEDYGKLLAVADNKLENGKPIYDNLIKEIKPIMKDLYLSRYHGHPDELQTYLDGFKNGCGQK
jgi:hypothetical protein